MNRALRPAAIAAALALGVFIADRFHAPFLAALLAGACGFLAIAFAAVRHSRTTPKPQIGDLLPTLSPGTSILILGSFALIGFSSMSMRVVSIEGALGARLDGRGVILEGSAAGDSSKQGRATALVLRAKQVDGIGARERIFVRLYGHVAPIAMGDRIRVSGRIRKLDKAEDFDRFLFRQGISSQLTSSSSQLELLGNSRNPALRMANAFRRRMKALVSHDGSRGAGLVLGLTIGDESLISPSVREDMRTAGLSHLTAVSGANLAILLGALSILTRVWRFSRRTQIAAGLLAIVLFVLVARPEPSVLRAAVMGALALSAFLFGRIATPLHGIAIAFVGLLLVDPMLLWSAGFQLSFAATAGILLITNKIAKRLSFLPSPIRIPAAVTLAAQVAVSPFLALHFARVPIAGVPANLVALPIVAPATLLGLAAGLVSFIAPGVAQTLFIPAAVTGGWITSVAGAASSLPYGSIALDGLTPVLALGVAMVGITLLAWILEAPSRLRATLVALAAVLLIAAWILPASGAPPTASLRMTFFDVGQGEAALIQSPDGAAVLIDGGPEGSNIASRLARLKVHRLDLVIASHAHSDHVEGLLDVVRRLNVRTAVHPGVRAPGYSRLFESFQPTEAGERFHIGALTLDVVGPLPDLRATALEESEEREGSAINDASVVVRVVWGTGCALFTGDIEETAQNALGEHPTEIDCTIMKAPHHGSPRIAEEFVKAVDPEWTVISVGRNIYGHPSRKAISLFEGAGSRVLRTDQLGDIVLELNSAGAVFVRR